MCGSDELCREQPGREQHHRAREWFGFTRTTAQRINVFDPNAIEAELKRLRQRSYELRTQAVTEKIEDTSQFAKARHDIARLLTEQNTRRRKVDQEIAGKRT